MAGYRELRVWQDSKALSVEIYKITTGGAWDKDWGLRDQIRRAAVSVPSNIAEGEARNAQKESVRFFRISLGSLAELSTQLEIALDIGYLLNDDHDSLQATLSKIQLGLGALARARLSSL